MTVDGIDCGTRQERTYQTSADVIGILPGPRSGRYPDSPAWLKGFTASTAARTMSSLVLSGKSSRRGLAAASL
jgi:hypothetical protein